MTKETASRLIQTMEHAKEKIRLQERHEERENALLDRLATSLAARKEEVASHAAIVAAMTTQHAKTVAELAMRGSAAATDAAAPANPPCQPCLSQRWPSM